MKWLGGGSEDSHIDIDSLSEGDTAALRESLAQLSNASRLDVDRLAETPEYAIFADNFSHINRRDQFCP